MTNSVPDGFGIKDKVTFDQLPEKIQEYYLGPKDETTEESLWLKEEHAVLMFFPLAPNTPWVHHWKNTTDGWVIQ